MVGFFLSGSAVGIYNLSTVLTQILALPSTGLNTIYPSIASRMYGNGEYEDLEALFTRVTRWAFTLSLLPALGLFVYSNEILSIFGEGFARGSPILSLFVVGYLANAVVTSTGHTLMMTDHQYYMVIDRWGLGITNAVLNYIFITRFGLIGAAFATATVLVTISIGRVVAIWYTEGLFPYSMKFLKPIAAGLVSGGVMVGWRMISPLSNVPLLVAGGVFGTIAYVLILFVGGIETEDREFFEDIVSRFD